MYMASCMAGSRTLSLSVKLKTMPPLSPTALVRDQIHPLSSETNSLAIMFMSLKLLTSLMYPLLMTLVHNIDHLHLWMTIPSYFPYPIQCFLSPVMTIRPSVRLFNARSLVNKLSKFQSLVYASDCLYY